MSALLALVLALPPQVLPGPVEQPVPDPLRLLPADCLIAAVTDPGPWRRHGAGTEAAALLGHEGLRRFLDRLIPDRRWLESASRHRLVVGIGWSDLRAGRLLLILEPPGGSSGDSPPPDLSFLGAEERSVEVDGVQVHLAAGGAWCRDDRRTLVLFRLDHLAGIFSMVRGAEAGGETAAAAEEGAAWLARRLRAARAGEEGTLAGLPSIRGLRAALAGDEDLLRIWVPFENWSMDALGDLLGFDPDAMPFDMAEILEPYGFGQMEGVGWTVSVDGRLLHDRVLVLGDRPMARFYGRPFAGDEVLGRFDALPGDTTMATITRFSPVGMVEAITESLDRIFPALGVDWRQDLPVDLGSWLDHAERIAAALGEEVTMVQRAEDLWEHRNGALWFEPPDLEAFQEALAAVPPEILALARQGMDAGPGGYRFALDVRDGRVYLATGLAEDEADGRLGEQRPWRRLRPWVAARLAAGGVNAVGYVGPEVIAEGLDLLRRDGLPPELSFLLPEGADLSLLPDFDFVASRLGGSATVTSFNQDGLMIESVGPFGYLGAVFLSPAVVEGALQGMSAQAPLLQLDEFEQDDDVF
ncbi:MAG: hypothetical protein D6702_12330 [Planctomycetota bacterium]|nr:MAG: hypothetical protein D6702_12330 [Planctomycetota bacterium]